MPFRWKAQENHLHQYADDVARAAADIVGKGVLDIHARTVAGTPVQTGRLKTGWQPIMPEPGPVIQGGVGTNVEYAVYVERGTGQAGAATNYPFLTGARFTMSWAGMSGRMMLAQAAQAVLPSVRMALEHLGGRLRQR